MPSIKPRIAIIAKNATAVFYMIKENYNEVYYSEGFVSPDL